MLIKKYLKEPIIKNYENLFANNDYVICKNYLKITKNFLYDNRLNDNLTILQKNNFKYYMRNSSIVIYKKSLEINDLLNLKSLTGFKFLFFKLNSKIYYNMTNYLFTNIKSFFISFYSLLIKKEIQLAFLIRLKK